MSKAKVAYEEKLRIVKDYLEGRKGLRQLARENNISHFAIRQWIMLYKTMGESGLLHQSKSTSYPKELIHAAVEEYRSNTTSLFGVCGKYGIRSVSQLSRWIMKYNGHEEIKSSSRMRGGPIMTKGRNTTFEERIEIVSYCIEHNRNYIETANAYKVSYQQVRNYVAKYDKGGIDALADRRGKSKPEDQLTELDRLRKQNMLLAAENKRLEMENELLKKLEELEGGRF